MSVSEARRAQMRAYYKANSGAAKTRARAAYARDPECRKTQMAAWWRRNKVKARVWERRWRQANKAKIRAYEHTRRALETGAGRANPIVIAAILEARVCYYCGCELVRQKAPHSRKGTIDHRTPLSRGGTNDASNLSAACASCNFSKNDLTEEEFRAGTRRKTKGRPEAA